MDSDAVDSLDPSSSSVLLPGWVVPRWFANVLHALAGRDPHRAIRLVQWVTASGVYLGCFVLMAIGVADGWMDLPRLAGWTAFVVVSTALSYVALRTGWSERFADPALTGWQIVMGVIASDWGYFICGPLRTVALLPLLVIFLFAAFALRWRQIAALTAFALASLGIVVFWLSAYPPPWRDSPAAATLPIDQMNYIVVLVVLPALAVIAARLSALRRALRKRREDLTQLLAEVQRLATTDDLTGLPNRRWMTERLRQEQQRADGEGTTFCVAIVDLDHFKRINDRLGHAGGDAALAGFSRRARSVLPARDVLARWGGEEFLLLMPGVGIEEATIRMEYLRQSILRMRVDGLPLTFSAGVAQHAPERDVLEDVRMADQRMYAAKQGGRDRVLSV
ncbi:MAG TPA: diguanylate cyclase [Lysobacter sp.]